MRLDHLLSMENRVAGSRMLQTRSYSEIEPAERAGEEGREARASAWKEDLVVQLSMIKHRASGEVH